MIAPDLERITDPALADTAYEQGVCWHTRSTEVEWWTVPPAEDLYRANAWPSTEWNAWDYYFASAEWVRTCYVEVES